jgi:hypothetical protein
LEGIRKTMKYPVRTIGSQTKTRIVFVQKKFQDVPSSDVGPETGYIDRLYQFIDRLCGLVVRVSGYRSRGPGFDYRRFQIL